MDNAHVAILEMSLPAGWFDVYALSSDANVRIGFNATFLHRILSSRDRDQQIHLVYHAEDSDRLLVHLNRPADTATDAKSDAPKKDKKSSSASATTFDKHFELPLMDIEEEGMQIPEIDYTAELSMQSSQFSDIITQLKMFGDTMDFQCSEEKISLSSTSHDQGKMFAEIGINDLLEFAIEEGANLAMSFSLTYLKYFCAYSRISEHVSIKFGESYPMRIGYSLGKSMSNVLGENEEEGSLVFHLAPKINDD